MSMANKDWSWRCTQHLIKHKHVLEVIVVARGKQGKMKHITRGMANALWDCMSSMSKTEVQVWSLP